MWSPGESATLWAPGSESASGGSTAAGNYFIAALSAEQTANLSAGDHAEFDSSASQGDDVTMTTGADQADGVFTLAASKTYKITASMRMEVNEGTAEFAWCLDSDGSVLVDDTGVSVAALFFRDNAAHDMAVFSTQTIIYTVGGASVDIKMKCTSETNLSGIQPGSRVLIETM